MGERQLNLFTIRSVLCERFDAAFFRALPRSPGIYLMSDERERILYVGKAKDLRARLGSYRYVNRDFSRKTARLVARVRRIEWRICESEELALLEENRLLRELRPRFNRMNTWPKAYRYIRIAEAGKEVQVSLTAESDEECYGAFKGASRQTFGALLRLLVSFDTPYSALPRRLLCDPAPPTFAFSFESARIWINELQDYLRGECSRLLKRASSAAALDQTPFHAMFRAADIALAKHFFLIGPLRNRNISAEFGPGRLIAQEQLDDLIVRHQRTFRLESHRAEQNADAW